MISVETKVTSTENSTALPNGPRTRCRSLCWNAMLVVTCAFIATIAVQLADVAIFDDLAAEFILVAGVVQVAIAAWCVQLWRARLVLPVSVLAFLGIEIVSAAAMAIVIPWPLLSQNESALETNDFSDLFRPADLTAVTPYDSPGFRGSDRKGQVREIRLNSDWNASAPGEIWRHSVGSGMSSFAVVGDFCLTQEQRGEYEPVVCYELKTGSQCWTHLDRDKFRQSHGDGPRATPTVDRGRVFALGATGILNALDGSTGKRIWSVNVLEDNHADNCIYGMSGSPLVVDGRVIVSPGGHDGLLVAYDCATGKKIWSGGNGQASYSSPQLATLCGVRQVLIFHADGLSGHDVESGKVLWNFPWVSNPEERNNVCQSVVVSSGGSGESATILIASGYGQGCALFEVARPADGFVAKTRWSNRNLKAKFSCVVMRDGYVYGLDERILTCLDLQTGERRWKAGRYGFGQVILVDDILVMQAESGEVVLVEASPARHHELARISALTGRTWNNPVIAGPYLLVRNDREAACYTLPLLHDDAANSESTKHQ